MSNAYKFRQYVMRVEMVEKMERYASEGAPLGDFLRSVIENNLKEAFGRADQDNQDNLAAIVSYVVNEMPTPAQGSPAAYVAWLKKHTLKKHAERRRKRDEAGSAS